MQLDGFVNSTTNNHTSNSKRQQHEVNSISKDPLAIFEDSNNNNGDSRGSRLNEALVPKILHQSTKSKILTNDRTGNFSKNITSYDYLPLGKVINYKMFHSIFENNFVLVFIKDFKIYYYAEIVIVKKNIGLVS